MCFPLPNTHRIAFQKTRTNLHDNPLQHPLTQNCQHIFCTECLRKSVLEKIHANRTSEIACQECGTALTPRDLRDLLTPDEMAAYERASVAEASAGSTLVTCPHEGCGEVMELVLAEPSASELAQAERELAGERAVSAAAARHRCQYRLRCRTCGTEFCAQCRATPYHAGYLCAEWAAYATAQHCRFCGAAVAAGASVCASPECTEKAHASCTARLACGHACCGIRDESTHPPCLAEGCAAAEAAAAHGQAGDDFCAICYVEELRAAPCVQLECGHIFHHACVLQKIRARWPASRITFGFLECPLCKQPIRHPALAAELAPCLAVRREVEAKALARLRELGLDRSDDITRPGAPFHGDPLGYAMHRFSYFMCYKCHTPYYGGERVCEGDQVREYDPKELLCAGCCEFSAQKTCPIHGNDYIEWKCRFCCNVAVYFCWGTTHFCEMCHRKAGEMARKPRDQLPKCTCHIKHPPNGEEFLIGCALCRLKQSCFK